MDSENVLERARKIIDKIERCKGIQSKNNDSLKNRISELEKDKSNATETINDLNKELDKIKKEKDELEEKLKEKNAIIDNDTDAFWNIRDIINKVLDNEE